MAKSHLALVSPLTENCTVADEMAIVSSATNLVPGTELGVPMVPRQPRRSAPGRRSNAVLRTREHLAQHEVERLIKAAGETGMATATPP